jgi:hypothetical protein
MVKALHSKMLLCDVMAEQKDQVNYKKRRQELEKKIDNQWEQLEKEKMAEFDERLREKLEKEYHKKMKNAKDIQDQLEEFKVGYIKKLKEEELEGKIIKKQVEDAILQERKKEQERKERAEKMKEDLAKANAELLEMQAAIAQKEKEEERRIEEFAKKKEAMDHLRRTKEEERFRQKQEVREQLINR